MALSISSLAGGPVSTAGGHQIDLDLVDGIAGAIEVVADGLPCYAEDTDGLTVRAWTPLLVAGTSLVTVKQGAVTSAPANLVVLERAWPQKLFTLRKNFPGWTETGARSLAHEERL